MTFSCGDIVNVGTEYNEWVTIEKVHYSGTRLMNYYVNDVNSGKVGNYWISAELVAKYNKGLIRGRKLDELGV